MFIVDAHCDTLNGMLIKNTDFNDESLQVNHEGFANASRDGMLQFFAVFESPSYTVSRQKEDVWKMISLYHKTTADFGILKILSKSDLNSNRLSALLSLEGLDFLQGDAEGLKTLYENGVRCISLTWNPDNEFACGVGGNTGGGLTDSGRMIVQKAMEMGILVDVSHICDKGFYEIAGIARKNKKPFVATHSNARKLCGNKRNLDDSMLRALAGSGGVAGINMYSCFLSDDCRAGIDEVIAHIEHICATAGPGHVGFGCDFDGIDRDKSAISGPQELTLVIETLLRINYSEQDVRNIASGNFLRVLGAVLE
ncbi:MAG: membrane dipeptidase [Clostridia bacterium]|nr:membrane dipeptidase [Clostridia bacterium]